MRNKLRLAVAVALSAGSIVVVSAPPAAATCRPESKIPCETETGIRQLLENCSTSFDPGLPVTVGVCDL